MACNDVLRQIIKYDFKVTDITKQRITYNQ